MTINQRVEMAMIQAQVVAEMLEAENDGSEEKEKPIALLENLVAVLNDIRSDI